MIIASIAADRIRRVNVIATSPLSISPQDMVANSFTAPAIIKSTPTK
jgi:hypothetical protein